MRWWLRFKVWVINLFAQKVPTPLPPPIIIPEPEEEPTIVVIPPTAVIPSGPKEPDYSFTPGQYINHYQTLWETMVIKPEKMSTVYWYINKIEEGKGRYFSVSRSSGVPWQIIAVIHVLESGGDFRGVLHNGERIIGTGKKTRLVPAGRGPFETWEEAAIDALAIKKQPEEWNIVNALYYLERFNGLGYLRDRKKPHSPYLWSFSKHYFRGKYTSDGNYSRTAVSKQCGAAVLLKKLGFLS
jgi:lysozyme family protein